MERSVSIVITIGDLSIWLAMIMNLDMCVDESVGYDSKITLG